MSQKDDYRHGDSAGVLVVECPNRKEDRVAHCRYRVEYANPDDGAVFDAVVDQYPDCAACGATPDVTHHREPVEGEK